jgi:hypothetical protein
MWEMLFAGMNARDLAFVRGESQLPARGAGSTGRCNTI